MGRGDIDDVTVTRRLDAADRAEVHALLANVADEDGFWPLSDQLVADLEHPRDDGPDSPIFVLASGIGGKGHGVVGFAQASRREGGWTMQVATHPGNTRPDHVRTLADAAVSAVDRDGDGVGEIDWWVYQPGDDIDAIASARGFVFDRDLLQMHRPLPAERKSEVETRSFVTGRDESAWLTVNNRAFAGHAEQGGWTLDTVRQRMDQPWFDPAGLRMHERDGRLAAFCWTKIHGPANEPDRRVGEIYVIGVDPDFQGLGLGRELTLAGLDHVVDIGVGQAMLYVDGGNTAATALYHRLGFEVRRTDRAFRRASRVSG